MSEMIERVARAIEPETFELPRINLNRFAYERAYRRAKAAIEAMKLPTPSMGLSAYDAWDAFGEDAVMGPKEVLAIWEAMIDAALNEPSPNP